MVAGAQPLPQSSAALGWDLRPAAGRDSSAFGASMLWFPSQILHFPRRPLSGVSAPRVSAGLREPPHVLSLSAPQGWMRGWMHGWTHGWMHGCLSIGTAPTSKVSLLQGACSWDMQVVLQLQPPEAAADRGRVQCTRAQHQGKRLRPLWGGHSADQPSTALRNLQVFSVWFCGCSRS